MPQMCNAFKAKRNVQVNFSPIVYSPRKISSGNAPCMKVGPGYLLILQEECKFSLRGGGALV